MPMSAIKEQVLEPIISNPKAQMAIGTSLMALPVDVNMVQSLNVYVTFCGGILGCIVAMTIIYKNIKQIRNGE